LNNHIFTSLFSPAIALTLAVPFVVLWFYRQERFYLFMIAAGFLGAAIGFMLQGFTLPIGLGATKLLSNCAFMVASISMASSVISRFGRPVPWLEFGVLAFAGLGAFCLFMFVKPDLTARVLAMNFALGGITLVVATELRALPSKGPVEHAMCALAILSGINFIVRPLALAMSEGSFGGYDTFYQSLYWTSALLSHGVFSLLIALTLLTAEAVDIIKALRSETLTDPLSGLLNRRGFDALASKILDQEDHTGVPVSLVVIDLDRFKALNDQYGHAAGDRVIAEFGKRLLGGAGNHAVAGRLGGEEFAVLLPMADAMTARLYAEGVRSMISASPIDGLPASFRVTASFGVATLNGDETLGDLTRRADEALYLAKRSGRDNVRVSIPFLKEAATSQDESQPEVAEHPFAEPAITAA